MIYSLALYVIQWWNPYYRCMLPIVDIISLYNAHLEGIAGVCKHPCWINVCVLLTTVRWTCVSLQIHTKDKELMLTVSSFIYLHYMCERGCHALPRAPLEEEGDPREVAGYSLSSSVPRPVLVPFQVARLFSKCRVVGFALDAFPEGLTVCCVKLTLLVV